MAGIPGIQFKTKGWTGSMTIAIGGGSVTRTATGTESPIDFMQGIADQALATFGGQWIFDITSAGLFRIVSGSVSAWTVVFAGTCGARLGFSSASYGAATAHTSDAKPPGAFFPYTDDFGILFTLNLPTAIGRGERATDSAVYFNTPGTNSKTPIVRFSCLRALGLEFVEAVQELGTPAIVQVWDGSDASDFYAGNIRTRESSKISGWTEFEIEAVAA